MLGKTKLNEYVSSRVSDEMAQYITRWMELYRGNMPWRTGTRPLSLGLPAAISREIATLVTIEAKIDVNGPEGADARAVFIRDALGPVLDRLLIATEYACAGGGVVFKPYSSDGQIFINVITAEHFYPTAFSSDGNVSAAAFIERKRDGRVTYTRVEEHRMESGGKYVIENRAYRAEDAQASDDNALGSEIPLTRVKEWAQIAPSVELKGITYPLFAYFRIPQGNVVNTDSLLGVSVFARADAAGLIEEADRQFGRLSWEYEGGELAVDAAADAFKLKKDRRGEPVTVLPEGKERLFRLNRLTLDDSGEKFKVFAPTLRDDSYARGLNRLLMRIEDACGLARGTYSDAGETVRTATELRISKQRTYAVVTAIQQSLGSALEGLCRAIDTLATLYELAPEGNWLFNCEWSDSVLTDADSERESDRQDVMDGLMEAWEYRVKWYGDTEEHAKAAVSGMKSPVDRALDAAGGEEILTEE